MNLAIFSNFARDKNFLAIAGKIPEIFIKSLYITGKFPNIYISSMYIAEKFPDINIRSMYITAKFPYIYIMFMYIEIISMFKGMFMIPKSFLKKLMN